MNFTPRFALSDHSHVRITAAPNIRAPAVSDGCALNAYMLASFRRSNHWFLFVFYTGQLLTKVIRGAGASKPVLVAEERSSRSKMHFCMLKPCQGPISCDHADLFLC